LRRRVAIINPLLVLLEHLRHAAFDQRLCDECSLKAS
jgi:hypothetical protein